MLFFHLALDTPVGEDGENTIGDLAADSFNREQSITDRMQQRELEAVLWPIVESQQGQGLLAFSYAFLKSPLLIKLL